MTVKPGIDFEKPSRRLLVHFSANEAKAFAEGSETRLLSWTEHGSRVLAQLLARIERSGHRFDLLVGDDFREALRHARAKGCDGVVTNVPPHGQGEDFGSLCRSLPCVTIGAAETHSEAHRVSLGEQATMDLAVGHLLARGYRRLGWASIHRPDRRHVAWRRAMKERGLPRRPEEELQPSLEDYDRSTPSSRWKAVESFLIRVVRDAALPIDALVCDNDGTARLVIEIMKSLKRDSFHALGVIGVDARPEGPDQIPLTSVAQDPHRLAEGALRLLLEAIDARPPRRPREVFLTPVLRVGETTPGPKDERDSSTSRRARRTEAFLRAHLEEADPIAKAAEAWDVERATLTRSYAKETGRSLRAFLLEARLGRAEELLLRTGFDMERIARECGFGSPVTFFRQVRRRFGTTPAALRLEG